MFVFQVIDGEAVFRVDARYPSVGRDQIEGLGERVVIRHPAELGVGDKHFKGAFGYGVWFLMLALGFWARFGGWWKEYVRGIWRGGWLTVGLVAVIGIFAGISFWQFFTVFHELFFTGNSW